MWCVYGERDDEIKKGNEDMKKKVECMRNIDEQRNVAGVYDGSESLKTWASIAKRLTNHTTIEKVERVEESMLIKKSEIRRKLRRVIMSQQERGE